MTRTLLTYPGKPAPEGNHLVPDVAASLPQVSEDLLTWTFTIKTMARFGPPISRPVICDDFQAAFERLFALGDRRRGVAAYFSEIQGADSFTKGQGLEGVQCQDQHTLVFKLTAPVGDFAARTALPAVSPIPAEEDVARHHPHGYGRFLVSTGPYMWQGMETVDLDDPVATPPAGAPAARAMTLVRNPDWDSTTDDVRRDYVNEIRFLSRPGPEVVEGVLDGRLDLGEHVPPPALAAVRGRGWLRKYAADEPNDRVTLLRMNMGARPFDDVHVRRAVSFVLDKRALTRIRGGRLAGRVATHVVPPSMPGGLPRSYDPYPTKRHAGDVRRARNEMRESRYDGDDDGRCDARACRSIVLTALGGKRSREQAASIGTSLEALGINVRVRTLSREQMDRFGNAPPGDLALVEAPLEAARGYRDPAVLLAPLAGIGPAPPGHVGKEWTGEDPSLEEAVRQCIPLPRAEREGCWREADAYLMEEIVPVVPLLWGSTVRIQSGVLASVPLPYAQFSGTTAYDQVYLSEEAVGDATPTPSG